MREGAFYNGTQGTAEMITEFALMAAIGTGVIFLAIQYQKRSPEIEEWARENVIDLRRQKDDKKVGLANLDP